MKSTASTLIFLFLLLGALNTSLFSEEYKSLYSCDNIKLASRLEIEIPPGTSFSPAAENTIHLDVSNKTCAWTIINPKQVYLINKNTRLYPQPFCDMSKPNSGRISSGEELILSFTFPEKTDFPASPPWRLIIESGIVSWEMPQGNFTLDVYQGDKLRVQSELDSMNRVGRVRIAPLPKAKRFLWTVPGEETIETVKPFLAFRVPILSDNQTSFSVHLTVEQTDGSIHNKDIPFELNPTPELPLLYNNQILLGACFYPATPDDKANTPERMQYKKAETSWNAPKLPEKRFCSQYVDDFIANPYGNLAVFWPLTPGASEKSNDVSEEYVRKLADAGFYSMTIYQNAGKDKVQRLIQAGKNRFFLNNNMGEYASYLYQNQAAAKACGVPESQNLDDCREFFVNDYMYRGVKSYQRNYPFVFSTSGSCLANYELAGGVNYMCSELFAIGAENLAWAGSEMRAAAKKWRPEFWGSWLAHEWQTGGIPYQTPQKYRLLRAALYQQYIMGASIIILESGTQTTQAGAYTKDAGKRNYSYDEFPPVQYRKEMASFYEFLQKPENKRTGSPRVSIALVLGNNDAYVGKNFLNFPIWAQHATARQNANWKYGEAEQTSAAAQNVFFPLGKDAVKPYTNRWLAGTPFGQADVIGIDDFTRVEDLIPYRLIVYSGWNSMTPKIYRTLCRYVNQGGTLILAAAHLSTRIDREGKNYAPCDIVNSGALQELINVRIVEKQAASGYIQSKYLPETQSIYIKEEPVAKVTLNVQPEQNPVETLAAVNGAPVYIRQKKGRGEVRLILCWEYPGKTSWKPFYEALIQSAAKEFRSSVYVESDPAVAPYISWAEYDSAIYVLNLDCVEARTCTLHLEGESVPIRLAPTELQIFGKR